MVLQVSWNANLLALIVQVDIKRAENVPKLDEEKATKGLNLLCILDVAKLDVLVTIETSNCLIKEILFEAGLRHAN